MDTTTSTQHSNAAIDVMGPITIVHVVLMIVLAIVAILIIWWGGVLRRRRSEADRQVAHDRAIAEEAGATTPPAVASPLGEDVPAMVSVPTAAARPAPGFGGGPQSSLPPVPEPSSPVGVAEPGDPHASDLTQLKGLGPKLAATLAELGYTRIDQIADLSPAEAGALDARLGAFQGRMARDRWIEQARLLTIGDRAGYEAQFGRL